jgi:hypothetical protein
VRKARLGYKEKKGNEMNEGRKQECVRKAR